MRLVLQRRAYLRDGTLSYLEVGQLQLVTLECPWEDNRQNESCIPLGIYPLSWYLSPSHGWVLRVHDVPGRTDIELHVANIVSELKGCIAVGMTEYMHLGELRIGASERAMGYLRELRVSGEPTELLVGNYVGGKL